MTRLGRLLGTATALIVGSGLYWLVGDPVLAVVTGLVWGVGIGLTVRSYRHHAALATGGSWQSSRWIGLGSGGITLAAIIGVSPSLPIAAELRLGLGALVIGTGVLATATATLAEIEREKSTATADEPASSTTETTDPN